jgi:hypothetical protein
LVRYGSRHAADADRLVLLPLDCAKPVSAAKIGFNAVDRFKPRRQREIR